MLITNNTSTYKGSHCDLCQGHPDFSDRPSLVSELGHRLSYLLQVAGALGPRPVRTQVWATAQGGMSPRIEPPLPKEAVRTSGTANQGAASPSDPSPEPEKLASRYHGSNKPLGRSEIPS